VQKQQSCVIFWFRRDLRLDDNIGLFHALQTGRQVLPVFIFDEEILKLLPANDHRLTFIYDVISSMHRALNAEGGRGIKVLKGRPLEVFKTLLKAYPVEAVYCNQDHEPYGMQRDASISNYLKENGIGFYSFTDHLITEKDEIITAEGNPYRVFTPYSRAWKSNLQTNHTNHFSSEDYLGAVLKQKEWDFPSLECIGFQRSELQAPWRKIDDEIISKYDQTRDIPSLEGTSRLGVHLRFGTISIRQIIRKAIKLNETFLNELIWREFYAMILWNYPRVVDEAFKPAYDRILWRNAEGEFESWKTGMTGYPMVDAGMRQLNATGYMHNRLRMVVASFLSKHLLIDWRWGEAYFAEKLFDFELSSNNGGWQWSAGTGCDAAPYFRIFNPASQQKKFDPQQRFIRQWIPEFGTDAYPDPMVDHSMARERCLSTYQKALK
jgi:deoxyribodipyrimidine photo-lyase